MCCKFFKYCTFLATMNGPQSRGDLSNPSIYRLVDQIKEVSISGDLSVCNHELGELFKELHNIMCAIFDEIKYLKNLRLILYINLK